MHNIPTSPEPPASSALDGSKLAIVVGSLLSGLLGWTLLSGAPGTRSPAE